MRWPDGTVKSQDNAFTIQPRAVLPPTRAALRHARVVAALPQKNPMAMRVNKDAHFVVSQSANDRTLAIAGKSAHHGR